MMELFELMERRHSVRSYKPDEVEEEKLRKVLEAARIAPTAANKQAFKVIVAKTKGNEEALSKVYGNSWFLQPPIVLCVCSVEGKYWVRRDGKAFGDVDAAIVMDHMILAATELGLGTCWIGAFNAQAAKEALKLEENWEPIVMTPLGYPADGEFRKIRKDLSEIVEYR